MINEKLRTTIYYDITIYITDQFRESMKKSTANRSAGERRN